MALNLVETICEMSTGCNKKKENNNICLQDYFTIKSTCSEQNVEVKPKKFIRQINPRMAE